MLRQAQHRSRLGWWPLRTALARYKPAEIPAFRQVCSDMNGPRITQTDLSYTGQRALGHWVVIDNRKIGNYQMVVPTTWNGSPRDHKGQAGAYEASLVGTPLAKPEWPLEILRTIHSFDPCMACAIHMVDADGNDLGEVATGLNVCVD